MFPFFFLIGTNTYLKTPKGEGTNYYRKMGLMDYRVARDRKYIYYRGVRQPRIDRETFEIIIDTTTVRRNGDFRHIYRDKDHVYDCEWYEDELHPVE